MAAFVRTRPSDDAVSLQPGNLLFYRLPRYAQPVCKTRRGDCFITRKQFYDFLPTFPFFLPTFLNFLPTFGVIVM